MNKTDAKELAETITNEQLAEMFQNAKEKITNWREISNVNRGMTKGVAWNILAKNFDVNHDYHFLAKMNMIREFGEFLPVVLLPKKKKRKEVIPHHENPNFLE